MIHIFNAGLMGWALTLAWREKRYLNLALTYLVVVIVHGSWNALAVFNILSSLSGELILPAWVVWIGSAAPYFLAGSALVMFALLLWMNSKLRRGSEPQIEPVGAASEANSQDSEPSEVVL